MKRLRFITVMSLVFCFVVVVSVHSQEWTINPTNGHEYMIYRGDLGGIAGRWEQAEEYAQSIGGHLVTINNKEENDWIINTLIPSEKYDTQTAHTLWIGLFLQDNGKFEWISGEPVIYTDWSRGEPDYQPYVVINRHQTEDLGNWYDTESSQINASIIEKTNQPESTPAPQGWIINPSNGHGYMVLIEAMGREGAEEAAKSHGGHLVSINNKEENDWIVDNILSLLSTNQLWIGLYMNDGKYIWSNGEDSTYFNWREGEPDGDEYFFIYDDDYEGKWADNENSGNYLSIIETSNPPLQTPMPTLTPTSTPKPTAPPPYYQPFEGSNLASNQLVSDPPAGFISGNVRFGDIPEGTGTDGNGMSVDLFPGNGNLIISLEPVEVNGLAHISGQFKASTSNVSLALIALNSPIDGQLAYVNLTEAEVPLNEYRRFDLYYAPPSGKLQVAVQVVNSPFSTLSSTVWVDNLIVEPPSLELGEPVTLEVDGTFEGELENLIVNMNKVDGAVIPFFESLTDIAIRISIEPTNMAANIGTIVTGVEEHYPLTLIGEVEAFRETPYSGGGLMSFVMTNAYQNVGLFRNVAELPGPETSYARSERVMIGGNFTVRNPETPIYVIIQNGGPGAESSLVIDNLTLRRRYNLIYPLPSNKMMDTY